MCNDHQPSAHLSPLTLSPIIHNSEVGKVVGGTKGNKVLDFISAAPAKERTLEEAPNMFDYSELTKYGYNVSTIQYSSCLSMVSLRLELLLYLVLSPLLTELYTHAHMNIYTVPCEAHYGSWWSH
jgi:hypothetical protein